MIGEQLLDRLDVWLLFILLVMVLFATAELGYHFGRRRQQRAGKSVFDKEEKQAGTLMGATLGLLAFMLAFTYGAANSIHAERKALVLEESNAIGTAWLRARFLQDAQVEVVDRLLREYVDTRIEGARSKDSEELSRAIEHSERILDDLWAVTVKQVRTVKDTASIALFTAAVNEVIDLHSKRINAAHQRIPLIIMATLLFISLVTLSMMGYQSGLNGVRTLLPRIGLILAFSAVMLLITDLDRPGQGLISVSQRTMVDLQTSMARYKAHP
ncbi:MAG: hypothetical protein ABW101_17200 [Candidatus Thiodiazotropha sp.]